VSGAPPHLGLSAGVTAARLRCGAALPLPLTLPLLALHFPLSAGAFKEGKGEIELPEISTVVLEKVLQYFHYKVKHHGSKTPIPEFSVPPELALQVLIAADYLEC
jgi:hypothetical protein